MIKKILTLLRFGKPEVSEEVKSIYAEDYDPQWVWDIYGTGIRPPKKPDWLDGWVKSVCMSSKGITKVELDSVSYDEVKDYFKQLDAHMGRKTVRPAVLQIIGPFGQIDVIRKYRGDTTSKDG